MAITLRWANEPDLDLVAQTRLRCYANDHRALADFRERIRIDPRVGVGDFLLAEEDSRAVGTATSIPFHTWIRGRRFAAQGVAWVGTVRTHRRRGGPQDESVASRLMNEVLRKARERGEVVSYLMPFRTSFYERFGYGMIERRAEWTVPLSILPRCSTKGLCYAEPSDGPGIESLYQRVVETGQCDLERSAARWAMVRARESVAGFEVIDRAGPNEPVLSYLFYDQYAQDGKDFIRVVNHFASDMPAFLKQLSFLAGLQDQYTAAQITLPADFPLNWRLKERQLPHRLVNHAVAECRIINRLQARVLDHRQLLDGMTLSQPITGSVVVSIHECEGTISKLRLTMEAGHVQASPTEESADIECSDVLWAALALGDLPASKAAILGLLPATNPQAIRVLDGLAGGPIPYCHEPF